MSIEKLGALQQILQANGYSITKQRKAVFQLLLGSEPLTMHELVERAAGIVDRASIYRTITIFEEIGVVHRISIGWKYKVELSEQFADHHHHLSCIGCGAIMAIGGPKLEQLIRELGTEHNFYVTAHQIELQGYCNTCQLATRARDKTIRS